MHKADCVLFTMLASVRDTLLLCSHATPQRVPGGGGRVSLKKGVQDHCPTGGCSERGYKITVGGSGPFAHGLTTEADQHTTV